MAVVQMDSEHLKAMLRGVVREVFQDEILKLKISLLPMVSDGEMSDIINVAGSPKKYENEEFDTLEL